MSNIYNNGGAVSKLTAPQVYQATHDEQGNLLSSTRRSYISFSWGDRAIEDFNFIVTNDSDMYKRRMYSEFKDLTTSYDIIDGQHFWKTTFEANDIDFTLSTDGVTEATLQSFRNYFQPGVERELQVSEFPNRAIMARVASVPDFNMMPFEKPITVKLGNQQFTTSTTLWKGSLNIHFVMDDPFWYNKRSYYDNANLDEDKLKAIIEDGIPHVTMFENNATKIFLGNNYIVSQGSLGLQQSLSIPAGTTSNYVLYYCGTAPEKPIINFSFNAYTFDGNHYCNAIGNEYVSNDYGKITIGNKVFEYTTPSILNAYNQAVNILYKYTVGNSIVDLKKSFRDGLNHFYVRMWALAICEQSTRLDIATDTGALKNNFFSTFIRELKKLFYVEEGTDVCKCSCTINSATGETTMRMLVNTLDLNQPGNQVDPVLSLNERPFLREENSGDMIRSQYMVINERTLPDFSYTESTTENGNDYGELRYNYDNTPSEEENNSENESPVEETSNHFAIIHTEQCLPVISNYDIDDVQILYHYKYL